MARTRLTTLDTAQQPTYPAFAVTEDGPWVTAFTALYVGDTLIGYIVPHDEPMLTVQDVVSVEIVTTQPVTEGSNASNSR